MSFLQGMQLEIIVTMKPPKRAGLDKDSLWVLEVPLYRLDDASLQSYMKCKDIFVHLRITESRIDGASRWGKRRPASQVHLVYVKQDPESFEIMIDQEE